MELSVFLIALGLSTVISIDASLLDCPADFAKYNDSTCIGVIRKAVTADQALTECKTATANYFGDVTLLIIRDVALNNWLISSPLNLQDIEYWLGVNDKSIEEQYVWPDGVKAGFHKWKDGDPKDTIANDELCVKMHNMVWEDDGCDKDYEKYCQYTLADATDVCPSVFSLMPQSSLCFAWFDTKSPFTNSRQFCKTQTAGSPGESDLASITNETIWAFITASYANNQGWIGLTDNQPFTYKWLNNQTLDWPPWMQFLVGMANANQDCVTWKSGAWDNRDCTDTMEVLCHYHLPKGMPFYMLENTVHSTCNRPANITQYPMTRNLSDGDLATCEEFPGQMTAIQITDIPLRKPSVIVVSNASCSPVVGAMILVRPTCLDSATCESIPCIPGRPVMASNNLIQCTYICRDFAKPRVGEVIITVHNPTRICDVEITV